MEQYCESIKKTGWKKQSIQKIVMEWEPRLKMDQIKKHWENVFGIQKSYRSKKEHLTKMAYIVLKGPTTTKAKELIVESLLYEEEVETLREYFTNTKQQKPSQKRACKKMMADIEKDSYKKDLIMILKKCGIPCSWSSCKKELLEFILLSFYEKPPKDVFCTQEIMEDQEEECAICTEGIEKEGVRWKGCACKIIYHPLCLEKWLSIKNSCPTCRAHL